MKNNTLHNAFPIVAAAIGNRFGIKVHIGGDQAYTNGQSIRLPAYNGDDPDYKDYAWGLLAHESAHIRYSDFTIDFGTSVLRRRLCGALEDVRIEHELAQIFPGTRLTLRTVVEKMIASGQFKAATADDHPANVLYGYVLKSLRARVLQQSALTPLVELTEQVLNSHFPAGTLLRLNDLLAEVPEELACERDCLHLTDRILSMIEQECEKEGEKKETENQDQDQDQTQPQQNSQAQPDSEQDTDTETDTGESDYEGDEGEAKAEAEAEANDQSPDCSDDSETTASTDISTDSGSPVNSDSDHQPSKQAPLDSLKPSPTETIDAQSLQQALGSVSDAELEQDLFEAVKAELALGAGHSAESVMPVGLRQAGDEVAGRRLLDKVQSESVKIRAALQGLVQAQNMSHSYPSCRGRRVIAKRLPHLALGDSRVFARGSVKQAPNTAIHLLLDKSASMSYQLFNSHSESWESRLTIALEATLALALAFEGIPGVNPGITAFPGANDESVFRVLEHGERVRAQAGGLSLQPQDSTPMTEAIWFAAASLLRCREPRKVLMVMTDGQPNDPLTTLEILQRCRDSGIETIGIGLGIDVSHLFPRAIAINDFKGLRSQLFELSKTVLMAA